MPEGTRMVPGFNHDIPHLGKAYHVQTEDLGVRNPHVVTHVFLGGSVVAVKRTSYARLLDAQDLARTIRELMKEQHKEMVRSILAGAYDEPAAAQGSAAVAAAGARAAPEPSARAGAAGSAPDGDDSLDRAILAYLAGEPVDRDR